MTRKKYKSEPGTLSLLEKLLSGVTQCVKISRYYGLFLSLNATGKKIERDNFHSFNFETFNRCDTGQTSDCCHCVFDFVCFEKLFIFKTQVTLQSYDCCDCKLSDELTCQNLPNLLQVQRVPYNLRSLSTITCKTEHGVTFVSAINPLKVEKKLKCKLAIQLHRRITFHWRNGQTTNLNLLPSTSTR